MNNARCPISTLKSTLSTFALVVGFVAGPTGVAFGAAPVVTVDVVPRIGLFNEVQYVRTTKSDAPPLIGAQTTTWSPLDKDAFLAAVPEDSTRRIISETISNNWELLTTFEPQMSYLRRKIRLSLRHPQGTPLVACKLHAEGTEVHGKLDGGGCSIETEVRSNAAFTLPVLFRTNGMADFSRVEAQVPEDYLIVIAGDSYASGEGNPDRPCVPRALGRIWGCSAQPLWMDEECHRSFWSAGMRSSLRMIARDSARRRGAYTVVNIACSGAGMNRGIMDNYEGAVPMEKIVKRHGDTLGLAQIFADVRRVPPQMRIMERLVQQGRPAGSGIDLLVMSAGGNDVEFGTVVLKSLTGVGSNEWVTQTERDLLEHLSSYEISLTRFAESLRRIPVAQLIWIPYPDVTDIGQTRELAVHCAGGPIGALSKLERFSIDSRERGLAYRILVRRLNDLNQAYSRAQRYFMLDRNHLDGHYKDHGWCAQKVGDGPYKPGERLIRKADESFVYQDTVHGTMHPTYQGHEIVAAMIDEALGNALGDPLDLMVDDGLKDADGRSWLRSPIRVRLKDKTHSVVTTHELCAVAPDADFTDCKLGGYDLDLKDGAFEGRGLLAVHTSTKRRFVHRVPPRTIDSTPPQIESCTQHRAGQADQPCGLTWVLAGDTLSFIATDTGSGLNSVTVAIPGTGGDLPLRGVAIPGGVRINAAVLPSGQVDLLVSASDRVGNVKAELRSLQVEKMPPVLIQLTAYGADFSAARIDRALPGIQNKLELNVTAGDAESTVTSLGFNLDGIDYTSATGADLAEGMKRCNAQGPRPPVYGRKLVLPVSTPNSKFSIWALDCALQPSEPWKLRVIRIRESASPALMPVDWAKPGAVSVALANKVMNMTSLFRSSPAANDPAFGIFAAWLNLTDGRVSPGVKVPLKVQLPQCQVDPAPSGQEPTLYAVLMAAEQCAERYGTQPQERAKFLSDLSDQLMPQP